MASVRTYSTRAGRILLNCALLVELVTPEMECVLRTGCNARKQYVSPHHTEYFVLHFTADTRRALPMYESPRAVQSITTKTLHTT